MSTFTQEQGNQLSTELTRIATRIREEGVSVIPPKQLILLAAATKLDGNDNPIFHEPLRKGFPHHRYSEN